MTPPVRNPRNNPPQPIAGLDLMRAVAIGLVLASHLRALVGPYAAWTQTWWGLGPLGVDLFFALSGFLIGRILLGLGGTVAEPKVLAGFWCRRWLRTLPLYYLLLAANVALMLARLGNPGVVLSIAAPYLYFGQCFLSRGANFFGVTWSLAVEEFFYLSFPLLWAGLVRLGMRAFTAYVTTGLLMLLVPMLLRLQLDPLGPRVWFNDVYPITVYRLDSIAVGVLAAALSLKCPAVWARWRYPGLGLGLIALVLDWWMLTNLRAKPAEFMLLWYFMISASGCALLLPWCSSLQRLPSVLLERSVAAVARWSYSLYLLHMLFLDGAKTFFGAQLRTSAAWSWLLLVLTLASCLLAAAALHHWFERPVMNLRERWRFTRGHSAADRKAPVPALSGVGIR